MQIVIEIPKYSQEDGVRLIWNDNFEIATKVENGEILITSNKAGLISLATQLLTLAQDDIPSGCHLHYDDNNSLKEGSTELVIQKQL